MATEQETRRKAPVPGPTPTPTMSAMDIENIIPAMDRVLLLTWLLKDFGWMSTNIYLGWPFGLCSILFHFIHLFLDPRPTFAFYNFSILCWVIGNWLWMSIEFVAVESSSDIHFGPHIPLATMSDELQMQITYVKIGLFAMSLISQLVMYVGIFTEKLEMPRNYDEDLVSTNELLLLCGYPANQTIRDEENEEYMAAKGISTAFVEYTYILFWIMKDLFWSCGTGDVDTSNEELAVFMEILALMCGIFALCSYFVTAYIYRRSWTCLFDALTTLCWIAANFTWMCGEFFLRYDNLQLDDLNEGNDRNTRIVATTFFATGMVLQLVVIVYLSRTYYEPCAPRRRRKKNFYPRIEMRGMVSNGVRAVSVVPRTMNSIRYRGMSSSDADDVILF